MFLSLAFCLPSVFSYFGPLFLMVSHRDTGLSCFVLLAGAITRMRTLEVVFLLLHVFLVFTGFYVPLVRSTLLYVDCVCWVYVIRCYCGNSEACVWRDYKGLVGGHGLVLEIDRFFSDFTTLMTIHFNYCKFYSKFNTF